MLAAAALTRGRRLQRLERFVVGRAEVGEVQFLLPVDLRGADLDSLVEIEKGKIQVYGLPGGPAAPQLGSGLNAPAMLVFRHVAFASCGMHLLARAGSGSQPCFFAFRWKRHGQGRSMGTSNKWVGILSESARARKQCRKMTTKQGDKKSVDRFRAKLADHAQKIGGVFVHYEAESGTWLMKVNSF